MTQRSIASIVLSVVLAGCTQANTETGFPSKTPAPALPVTVYAPTPLREPVQITVTTAPSITPVQNIAIPARAPTVVIVAPTTAATQTATPIPEVWRTYTYSDSGLSLMLPPRYAGGLWEQSGEQFVYQFKPPSPNNAQDDLVVLFVGERVQNVTAQIEEDSAYRSTQAVSGTVRIQKTTGDGRILTFLQVAPVGAKNARIAVIYKPQTRALLHIDLLGDRLVQPDLQLSPEAQRIVQSIQFNPALRPRADRDCTARGCAAGAGDR